MAAVVKAEEDEEEEEEVNYIAEISGERSKGEMLGIDEGRLTMNLMRPYKRYESFQRPGRLIGVDVGSRWLGLAVSDLHYQFAVGDVRKVLCQA
ncbi:hypothetical protein Tco_1280546 [Tanacetum coccineum]